MGKNVTLNLPDELVRKARHLAVDRGLSLSGLFVELLEQQADAGERYEAARLRQQALMQRGLKLNFKGQVPWTRDALHER